MATIEVEIYTPDGYPNVFEGVTVDCIDLLTYYKLTQITNSSGVATFLNLADGNYRTMLGKNGYDFQPLSFDCYLTGDSAMRVICFSTHSLPAPAPPLETQTKAENVINRVREHFDDISDEAYSLFSKIEWLNSAQRDLALKMPVSVLEKIIVTIPNSVVSGDNGYITMPNPNNFLKLVNVIYRDNSCRFIHSRNLKMIKYNFDLQDTDTEPIVFWENNNLRIKSGQYPFGNTETAKLVYVRIPTIITELTSVIDLDNFLDLIYFYSLSQGYGKDKDSETSDKYLNFYSNGIKEEWQKELINRG